MSLMCCNSVWGQKGESDINDTDVSWKARTSNPTENNVQPITKPPTGHSTPTFRNKAATIGIRAENIVNKVKSPALSRITSNVEYQADDFHSVYDYNSSAYLSIVDTNPEEAHTSYRTVKSNTSSLFSCI